MEDETIVALYWDRNEQAVAETEKKYDRYLTVIANNILADIEDSRECVNDTYLHAWNSMPPQKPALLSTYLGRITRQVSIDRWRKRKAMKRNIPIYNQTLEELSDCIPDSCGPEQTAENNRLSAILDDWLHSLPIETRRVFLCRYYYSDSIRDIAAYASMTEAKVKSMLFRTRQQLCKRLEKEGIFYEKA